MHWGGDRGGVGEVGSSPQPLPRRASPGLTCTDRLLGRLGRRGRWLSGSPGEAVFRGWACLPPQLVRHPEERFRFPFPLTHPRDLV